MDVLSDVLRAVRLTGVIFFEHDVQRRGSVGATFGVNRREGRGRTPRM